MTFHGLSHEHGSILLVMGMDLMAVAEQIGYSSMQMLISTYGHNLSKKNLEVADYMEKAIYDDDGEQENDNRWKYNALMMYYIYHTI